MARKSEHERRADLIAATIREIAANGSLGVTTSQIAKSAGVSSGLAFHYFKDKDSLFLAAMRDIMASYARDVRIGLNTASDPHARLEAIIRASFGNASFKTEAVSAWLNFYTLALKSVEARRLLHVYQHRLHSNLVFNLRFLVGDHAPGIAHRIAGLIDGLYLRYALDNSALQRGGGADHVLKALELEYARVAWSDRHSETVSNPGGGRQEAAN